MNDHLGEDALAYVTGELVAQRRAWAEAHLARCAECSAEVRRLRLAAGALAGWPTDPDIPAALAKRIVQQARPRESPQRWPARWLRIAAIVVLMMVSAGIGYRLGGAARARTPAAVVQDSLPSFLLLLEESSWPPVAAAARGRAGYVEWASAIRQTGQFVAGEKLTDEPGWRILSDGSVARPEQSERPPNVSGWFLVRAQNYDAAIEWVRRGPHLRYGSVLVRQVE